MQFQPAARRLAPPASGSPVLGRHLSTADPASRTPSECRRCIAELPRLSIRPEASVGLAKPRSSHPCAFALFPGCRFIVVQRLNHALGDFFGVRFAVPEGNT